MQGFKLTGYLAGQAAAHLARVLANSGCLPATERSRRAGVEMRGGGWRAG